MSELRALLTPAGLELLDAVGPIESTADVARTVSRLRAGGHSPELVSAVVGQARLRSRATAKFGPFAARMLFTRAGLEQATRLGVAARHAQRIRHAGFTRVADLGCGIGGDALAFAGAGLDVRAVDADDVTSAIAAYNLAPFGDSAVVDHRTAEDAFSSLDPGSAVWMDPARRTSGHSETRRVSADDYSPSLDWAFEVAAHHPTGIKLGPAHDRDALPVDAEAQWVSADGSVVELVVWSGALAREGVRRAALVIRDERSHELTAPADAPDETRARARRIRARTGRRRDPCAADRRGRRSLEAGMLDEHIAYLTSDAALTSPFVQSFRVRETLPAHPKAINAALQAQGIGRLEIKKRGVDVDPAAFRKKLTLRGDQEATLILARIGDQRRAILADRVPAAN